jgi:hypothetical protein
MEGKTHLHIMLLINCGDRRCRELRDVRLHNGVVDAPMRIPDYAGGRQGGSKLKNHENTHILRALLGKKKLSIEWPSVQHRNRRTIRRAVTDALDELCRVSTAPLLLLSGELHWMDVASASQLPGSSHAEERRWRDI